MHFVELIRRKRDGHELSPQEIEFIVSSYTANQTPDYQVSALLMAMLLRGLNAAETAALTGAMLHSGITLDWSSIPGAKIDKHSTGGVGDKTSLILAPVVAAGGVKVPMVSGRGLGHTGGTLDKLEAIPGFNVHLSLEEFHRILARVGCAMCGQTADIAPADKKLYALRDVTGTVESPSLICASIMSKKLAEGIDGLVLDVKTGSGAFMKTLEASEGLAQLMVETGERMGKKMVALITDMDQPLGSYMGNALEVVECVNVLRGDFAGAEDLVELTLELCGWMFLLGGRTTGKDEGRELARQLIDSGQAYEKFREMVREQGGDLRAIDDLSRLPTAAHRETITAPASGFVQSIACEQVGVAGVGLGGGRFTKEDAIDPAVGVVLHKKVGASVAAGEPLCTVHYNSPERMAQARPMLEAAFAVASAPVQPRPLLHKVIVGNSSGGLNE